ncbi:MAG: hypothetical protein K6G03_08955 [Lachnospiraceae bacterium]|nr:hypothetical protein [Lachnospiraceae bacterium]
MGIEKKIKALFDYQRFEQDARLKSVIDDVNDGLSKGYRLSDDELEYAAGGVQNIDNTVASKSIKKVFCPGCNDTVDCEIISGGRARCINHGHIIYDV